MGRTTDEWAELLNNTTPGPWEAREDHGGMNLFAGSERVFGSDSCGDVSGAEEDVRLAAHAPAAVAEVVRLRRELEELREVFVRAAEMMGKLEIPADRQQAQGFAGRITRILEATHE